MKLTKNTYTKVKPGVTLIELTVVIVVLLTLIGVLFIGANIYKRGADRAACILNIRNIQQAVRANQNLRDIDSNDTTPLVNPDGTLGAAANVIDYNGQIFTAPNANANTENFLVEPDCPRDSGLYTRAATIYPDTGDVAVTCSTNGNGIGTGDHFPPETDGW